MVDRQRNRQRERKSTLEAESLWELSHVVWVSLCCAEEGIGGALDTQRCTGIPHPASRIVKEDSVFGWDYICGCYIILVIALLLFAQLVLMAVVNRQQVGFWCRNISHKDLSSWICVPSLIVIHPIVAEIFQSDLKWPTRRHWQDWFHTARIGKNVYVMSSVKEWHKQLTTLWSQFLQWVSGWGQF